MISLSFHYTTFILQEVDIFRIFYYTILCEGRVENLQTKSVYIWMFTVWVGENQLGIYFPSMKLSRKFLMKLYKRIIENCIVVHWYST